MKFSCKKEDLLQALNLVSRAIGGQQALPILGNILLEAEGKRCTVSATDLELSIITSFGANIENEGAITIPAKAFLNFAQYNSDDEILLETSEGTQLKCTSEHAKTVIAGESAQEYPTITPIEKETSLTLEAPPLLGALHMVTFASARTTLRPVLSGVYLRAEKGQLIFVATDSYRLSEFRITAEGGGTDISCIIPVKVLEELRSILSSRKTDAEKKGEDKKEKVGKIEVALSSQQIELRVGNTILLSRLIDGKFPDYQQIIPSETKTTVVLPTKELTTTIKRMHYFAKEINNNLTFEFKKGHVRITTPQTQAGQDETTLSVSIKGGDNKIALSSSYLLDFLSHVGDEEVEFKLTDSMHPALFHLPSNDLFLHLIMPLRIQEE
ncbi:DNA polymerase III subunit beta [Candidatus Peribacteria bacterium RIFOXYC2_FULL_55_14]|nr:MAG: polymerase III subunit beta protein [Candidatus Peribacteria bacterium GW2011_GWB1_54_5]KKW39789.1 MAG: polymerase III subunit beta protein [Candidatus Peribacteria bacterium GW2011_GWC2_54_8]OGJ72453.1 MAG: DNA polymerase III subunit beta [Candidatus Peribacteria bacterium RIFOXYA1_FULL_56_14]OGJ73502.1 MAG: DNA polymerase III subunit beta [Candidatus Peribacteria bacterium RIFOXYA2_FULL_55_28]OGJ74683.1 MAG: DNA polymerase III subunit beta [Candidatus Peribacteria bacterium RIFOXYB1_F